MLIKFSNQSSSMISHTAQISHTSSAMTSVLNSGTTFDKGMPFFKDQLGKKKNQSQEMKY